MIKIFGMLQKPTLLVRHGGLELSKSGKAISPLSEKVIDAVVNVKQFLSFKGLLVTSMLLLLILLSAIGVVYSSHLSRQLFTEQAVLQDKNDQMQLEWAQLLLEQSAWSTPSRIENIANDKLKMNIPKTKDIQLIY